MDWKRLADLARDDIVPLRWERSIGEPAPVPLPVLDQAYYTATATCMFPTRDR